MATPPTSPYCTSADVYTLLFMSQDPTASDFAAAGTPPKAKITSLIGQVCSRIDMEYAAVGYYVPFQAYTSETWPTHQTSFMTYFAAVGTAAFLGSKAMLPRAADFSKRQDQRSWYNKEWDELLDGIRQIRKKYSFNGAPMAIRALCRPGTPADRALQTPMPILTDFLEGYRDPTRYDLMREFTDRYVTYMEYQAQYNYPSDADPNTPEWLYYMHYRLGYTYDD